MMKERAINLKAHEVKAIIEGKKTQLRRVLNYDHPVVIGFEPNGQHGYWKGKAKSEAVIQQYISTFPFEIVCPFGIAGEHLWVREAWSTYVCHACFDGVMPSFLENRSIHYWADGECQTGRKRPSCHMPRWASRLLLEITNIRVERLNDISQADTVAEGGAKSHPTIDKVSRQYGYADWSRSHFAQTWDWHNTVKWIENPWVWVIEFKTVEPIDKA